MGGEVCGSAVQHAGGLEDEVLREPRSHGALRAAEFNRLDPQDSASDAELLGLLEQPPAST